MFNNTQNNIELKQGSSSTSTRKRVPKIKSDDTNYKEIISMRRSIRNREKLARSNENKSQLRQKYLEIYKGLEGSLKFLDNAPNTKNFIEELFSFANRNRIRKSVIQFDPQKKDSSIITRARQQIYLKSIKGMEKGESIENIKNIITKILNDCGAPYDDTQTTQHHIISTSQEDAQQHSKLSTNLQPSYSDNQASNYTSQENYLQLQLQLPPTYHETYPSFSGNKDIQLSSPHQQYLSDNAHQYGVLPAHPNSLPKLNTWQDFNQNPIQRPIPIRPIPIQKSPLPSSQYQYPSGILELNSHKHLDLSKNSPQCPSLWRTW